MSVGNITNFRYINSERGLNYLKLDSFLLRIFSIGTLGTLFAGGVTILVFIYALFVGGSEAVECCVFIRNVYFPYVIQICSFSVLCGLIGMYLKHQVALTIKEESDK